MGSPSPHVVVLGAAGAIGHRIVIGSLPAGRAVTAVARDPAKFHALGVARGLRPHQVDRLRVVRGDARRAGTLESVLGPGSVVVSAFGVSRRRAHGLFSESAAALVETMSQQGAQRIIAITSAGVRADDRKLPAGYRLLVRPLLRDLYEDMARMEEIIAGSSLEWCFVRPVFLTDHDADGVPRAEDGRTPTRGRSVSRAAVANFIVSEVSAAQWTGQAPTLAD